MIRARPWILCLPLALAFLLSGCGGEDPIAPDDPRSVPARLAFATQPVPVVAGEDLGLIQIEVLDEDGSRVTDVPLDVSLAVAGGGQGELLGVTTATAAEGLATFDALSLERSGDDYRLEATADAVAAAVSGSFEVASDSVVALQIVSAPTRVEGRAHFDPPLRVALVDRFGNVADEATSEVVLSLVENPTTDRLEGSTRLEASGGVATFEDLLMGLPGDGYVLEATSAGLPPVRTDPFTVGLTFTSIAAGYSHVCALTAADAIYCWGSNAVGQLGIPDIPHALAPRPVRSSERFRSISAGANTSCALSRAGVPHCWGLNTSGQLGDGTTADRSIPGPIAGNRLYVSVATSGVHSCAIAQSDELFCWGDEEGFGPENSPDRPTPVPVPLPEALVSLSLSAVLSTCGLTAAGRAYCWGQNDYAQFGDGTATGSATPTIAAGGRLFRTLRVPGLHACGIATDGEPLCWGNNSFGQLGMGQIGGLNQGVPAPLSTTVVFQDFGLGLFHSCAVTDSEGVACWGRNESGEVGDGSTDDRAVPVVVTGVSGVQVVGGLNSSCALAEGGAVYCWGSNSTGALGDGTGQPSTTPVAVVR